MAQPQIRRFEQSAVDGLGIRGFLHTPREASGDGLVLTHGAGQNSESPLLIAVATAFCDAGLTVLRCDLPFRQLRPQGPPTWPGCAEHDRQGLKRAVEAVREVTPGRMFLAGHSYGGRQSSMLAAEEPGLVEAILLLAYPLHTPKRPIGIRTAHFPSLKTPALFVSGTRDGFATVEELAGVIQLIPARTKLLSIEGAGHELLKAKNRETLPAKIAQQFKEFVG